MDFPLQRDVRAGDDGRGGGSGAHRGVRVRSTLGRRRRFIRSARRARAEISSGRRRINHFVRLVEVRREGRGATVVTKIRIAFSSFGGAKAIVEQTRAFAGAAGKPVRTVARAMAIFLAERARLHAPAVRILRRARPVVQTRLIRRFQRGAFGRRFALVVPIERFLHVEKKGARAAFGHVSTVEPTNRTTLPVDRRQTLRKIVFVAKKFLLKIGAAARRLVEEVTHRAQIAVG